MALIKCKECANQVSTDAKACPQCGAEVKQPLSRLKVFFIAIVGVVLFMAFQSDKTAQPIPVAKSPTPEQVAENKKRETEFQMVVIGAKALRESMKNPDSFNMNSAGMTQDGSICYEYRSTNSFNAVVAGKFVISKKGGSAEGAAWNKYCAGKSATDYTHATHAL